MDIIDPCKSALKRAYLKDAPLDELREIYESDNEYELVIRLSKTLENWLKEGWSAQGRGLRKLVDDVDGRTQDWAYFNDGTSLFHTLFQSIRQVAMIRNKLVHESGSLAWWDLDGFMRHFEIIIDEFESVHSSEPEESTQCSIEYEEEPVECVVYPDLDELQDIYKAENIYEQVIRLSKTLQHWLIDECGAQGTGLGQLADSIDASGVEYFRNGQPIFRDLFPAIRKVAQIGDKLLYETSSPSIRKAREIRFLANFEIILSEFGLDLSEYFEGSLFGENGSEKDESNVVDPEVWDKFNFD